MSTIIQSNKLAEGDFLYPTQFGPTYLEVKNYLTLQENNSSTITQQQFDALHNLHARLKAANLYSNVLEIMPMLGNKMAGMFCKSKFVRNSKLIDKASYGSNDNYRDGDKGIQWLDYRPSNALAMDTGLIDSDFVNGMRFSTYVDLVSPTVSGITMGIFGKGPAIVNSSTRFFYQQSANKLVISTGNTFSLSTTTIDDPCLISGALKISNSIVYQRKAYKNSDLIVISDPTETALDNNISYYIAGLNQDNVQGALYGLFGKMRFFIITNGNITEAQNIDLINICQQYITEAGKQF